MPALSLWAARSETRGFEFIPDHALLATNLQSRYESLLTPAISAE
ncbi:MAG: hypothetical protein KatS3mg113_1005 [Planctomycetaceae bacterium]|nr:MAG: hypothetical protein KatS3mg113_1005 [Planctomycetaceae bacterium]